MTDVQQVDAKVDTRTPGKSQVSRPTVGTKATGPTPIPGRSPEFPPRVDAKDPRYLPLRNFAISMSIFNILGYTVLGFEQPWLWPFLALLTGYTAEISIEVVSAWAQKRQLGFRGHGFWGLYTFLLPTHITSLAVNLLLYANERFWPVAFGIVVAIGAKTVLRAPINGKMRHYMNPSNFGITATLVAFGSWASIAPPYEFTENIPDVFRIMVPMIIITAGTVLNAQLTKKVPLIVGWVGGFVIQALIRWWIWDVALWSALSVITGVAFVLFTNYMITDPGTSPSKGFNQFMFGAWVAIVYGALMVFNVVYTLFFAVTIVCFARGMLGWVTWYLGKRKNASSNARSMVGGPILEAAAR
jgi:hypothetical protein